jgi:hypothetical protein
LIGEKEEFEAFLRGFAAAPAVQYPPLPNAAYEQQDRRIQE